MLASIEPSAAPAPTRVCNSSMNKIISPFESSISFSTRLRRRSSNSPRRNPLRTSNHRRQGFSAHTRLPFRISGTSPRNIRRAKPLHNRRLYPRPGSPRSAPDCSSSCAPAPAPHGRISSSPSITSRSSFLRRASSVRIPFRILLQEPGNFPSGFGSRHSLRTAHRRQRLSKSHRAESRPAHAKPSPPGRS